MAPRKGRKGAPERPRRRKPGTGAVRYKPGRELPYEAAFKIGPGQYRYDYFATAQDAAAHLDRLTQERDDKDAPRNVAAGSQRLDTYLEKWLQIKSGYVKPKTLAGYTYYCELAIGWFGGSRRLDSILREDGDAMLVSFAKRDFKNVGLLRMTMRQAFQYAEDEQYIKKNPFQKAKAPPMEHRHPAILTTDQRAHLLTTAAETDDPAIPLLPLWHLYSRLGLRKGEGMALQRGDIDWKAKTLRIARHLVDINGKTVLSTPKTRRSYRIVPLPDDILDMLRSHLDMQAKRAASNPNWRVTGYIFTSPDGDHLTGSHIQHRWVQLRKRASISQDVTIHGLRHTADYLMEDAGAPQSARWALLGHASIDMDRRYTDHATMQAMRDAIERSA